MPHETALIATLAVGFALAFLFGFLAARLRLPPLVGYLFAGVLVGPFTPGFVADAGLAGQLAEIGVILLMFGVGLHFSVADLLAVRKIALPGAAVQITVATVLGAAVSHLWGWSWSAAFVFGLALSVASTVVLLRALEERGLTDSPEGQIAIGWLVVEDLATVLALVLLPALAGLLGGTGGTAGAEAVTVRGTLITVGVTLGKVAVFAVLMYYVGRRAVPWLLERVARQGSRELFTLSILAVAIGIAVGAAVLFDVSFALGAFFAGVVISESDLSHQAGADVLPFQDAFAVLFFVSVGMLFDPAVIVEQPVHLLVTLLIVIIGKSIAAFLIVLVFRYPVRTALTISASLAQIGEFSFILAGLGVSLGLLPEEGRSVILAVAILSITLNPVLFGALPALEEWCNARPRLFRRFERGDVPVQAAAAPSHRDHAVIVGYGRVGSAVGDALTLRDIPFVAIEQDRLVVEALRRRGIHALFGDAARASVLAHADLEAARMLVITTPDKYQARRIIDLARGLNPAIDIVVRTHSRRESEHLESIGVGRAVMGERELALGMAHYALIKLGQSDDEADVVVGTLRQQSSFSAPGRASRSR